jgi:hypothetical protein
MKVKGRVADPDTVRSAPLWSELHPESIPLVTRRYFVTCKSHVTSGGRDWERHFLLGGGAGESQYWLVGD